MPLFRRRPTVPSAVAGLHNMPGGGRSYGDELGRPIGDSQHLIDAGYTPATSLPDLVALRRELAEFIANSTVDAGHADYADQWIAAKMRGWKAPLDEEHRLRVDATMQLVAARDANYTVAYCVLAEQRRKAEQLEKSVSRYRAALIGGADSSGTPAVGAPSISTEYSTIITMPPAIETFLDPRLAAATAAVETSTSDRKQSVENAAITIPVTSIDADGL